MLFTRLLDRLPLPAVPTQCAICRDWGGERVCGVCRERFIARVPRCRRCALRMPDAASPCGACLTTPPAYDGALAAADYAPPWDHLIAKLKFHEALDLCASLARLVDDAWRASGAPRPGLMVPVPLGAARLRERGYNQSWEIARRLARRIGCESDASLLRRVRDTPHQLALPPERRAANVHDAFAIAPGRVGTLRGRRVTLVDDVMTTGATANEIARVLRGAGAAAVDVWVVARTPRPSDI